MQRVGYGHPIRRELFTLTQCYGFPEPLIWVSVKQPHAFFFSFGHKENVSRLSDLLGAGDRGAKVEPFTDADYEKRIWLPIAADLLLWIARSVVDVMGSPGVGVCCEPVRNTERKREPPCYARFGRRDKRP